ncbi:hypothetical protein ACWF2L_12355 [Streptomyces anulatus]
MLFEARPAGLHFPQLVAAGELSVLQAHAGLACLRDVIAEKGWPPLTWTRADGYGLGADKCELEAYERTVAKENRDPPP